jgi:hypothetical protein
MEFSPAQKLYLIALKLQAFMRRCVYSGGSKHKRRRNNKITTKYAAGNTEWVKKTKSRQENSVKRARVSVLRIYVSRIPRAFLPPILQPSTHAHARARTPTHTHAHTSGRHPDTVRLAPALTAGDYGRLGRHVVEYSEAPRRSPRTSYSCHTGQPRISCNFFSPHSFPSRS